MSQTNENSFNWGSLILGIIFILLSLVAFNNPTASLLAVVFMFAIGAILKGIFEIFLRNRMKEYTNYNHTALIVIGVIDIIIGVIILFNIELGLAIMPFLFAFWFIFDSIGALFTASAIRPFSNARYWFTIILGIIGVILGIALLFMPATAYAVIAMLVGIYFMIAGIAYIVAAF